MRVTLCAAILMLVANLGAAVRPVRAQSLGDVARQEEERRKDVKAPAKVYSNKDLTAPPPVSAPADAPKAPAAAAAEPSTGAAKATEEKGADGPAKDQAYWAKRKKDLQTRLSSDKVLADSVQSRINALTADFAARDNPIQRAAIERDRVQALAELSRLQQEIKDTQKALNDLDEEARRAGVPPGWLR
jgi:type IV secretory pathway VirB10-like protein